jgi:glycosyltransferase involved in cell wall biosynthesis
MSQYMKKILLLKPLKDIPSWVLTNHARNVFPGMSPDKFEVFGFFSNPAFAKGSLKQLPYFPGLRGIWQEIKDMRRLRPDIVYGTGTISEFFILLFRPRNAKYVVSWHGPYDRTWLLNINGRTFRAYISFWIATYLLGRADLITGDTEYIVRSVRAHFTNKKVEVEWGGVDSVFYDPAKKDTAWLAKTFPVTAGRPTFIFVGHLIQRKRPQLFVELARRVPEAAFILVGREGLYTKTDVEQWKSAASNLEWVPSSISREDMPKLFASAAGLVFPSLDEPFGLSVVEAMASGAVVMATRSGALPEIIDDGTDGFLIEPDGNELARYEAALRTVMRGGATIDAIRKRARAKAVESFQWAGVTARYEKAFNELLKEH